MSILFDDAIRALAQVLYLAFPVMFAAAIHIAVIRYDLLAGLKIPIDFGRSVRGRRIFGDNKTWRGALVMVTASSAAMAMQRHMLLTRPGAVRLRPGQPLALRRPARAGFRPGRAAQ